MASQLKVRKGKVAASKYAWRINNDFHAAKDQPEGTNMNAVGMLGPADINEELLKTEGKKFRMYSDDFDTDLIESRLYEGEYFGEGDEEPWATEEQFEPLDDFGMPNAGCTIIAYLEEKEPEHKNSVVEKTSAGYWVML